MIQAACEIKVQGWGRFGFIFFFRVKEIRVYILRGKAGNPERLK